MRGARRLNHGGLHRGTVITGISANVRVQNQAWVRWELDLGFLRVRGGRY